MCVLFILVLMWFSLGFLKEKVYEVADETGFLAAVEIANGNTIKSLNDVQVNNKTVLVWDASITIDLAGHTLDIVNNEGAALWVSNGSVKLVGEGEFNVSGVGNVVIVQNGGSAVVTNVTATTEDSFGVGVFDLGSSIEINGYVHLNVTGERGYGVAAELGGKVLVKGDVIVTGTGCAAFASGFASSVEVLGNVEVNSDDGISVFAHSAAGCVVRGEARINGLYGYAAFAEGKDSTVEVMRDVIASNGGAGAGALNGGQVLVHGNALSYGDYSKSVCIPAEVGFENPGLVIIGGNAESRGKKCKCVSVDNCGKVIIKGNVLTEGCYVEPREIVDGLTIGGKYHGTGTCLSAYREEGRDEECSIIVFGNVVGKESNGARADGGIVTVHGDVTTSEGYSAGHAFLGGKLQIYGDVTTTGDNTYAVGVGLDGTIVVRGNVKVVGSNCFGVNCSQGTATVVGNIIAIGENSIGAHADLGGVLTIGGSITAPKYIQLSQLIMTAEDGIAGEGVYQDYLIYSVLDTIVDKITTIRVKNATSRNEKAAIGA